MTDGAPGEVATYDDDDVVGGGMTCAACAGRVERGLGRLDGVRATVNLVTERARVHAPAGTDPATILRAVERAADRADLVLADRADLVLADRADLVLADRADQAREWDRDLRRRLAVAAVLAMPLADLSLVLSLFPELHFPGWEYAFLALTLPMVFWCPGSGR